MPVKNVILKRLTKQEALFVDEYFCNNFNAAAAYRKVYKVNDFYKKFYKDEDLDSFDKIQNPSSNSLSSSRFK